jgi:cob(I)alamin adenosyltransferase
MSTANCSTIPVRACSTASPACAGSSNMSEEREERHVERMERKKSVVDGGIAAAQVERGLLLVNTGNGKGKSSAAFGLLARALGHALQAAVVQFVKSRSDTGEEAFFRKLPGVRWHVMGEGFTWETQDRERDAKAARAAWDLARAYLADAAVDLVILDEMTYASAYRWLELDEVLAVLRARPPLQHVVITGRAAPKELVAAADTVTDMGMVKHAFQAGVKAMPGVEW